MRPLEVLVIALAVLSLVAWILPRPPLSLKLPLTATAVVASATQILLEGYRFPMLPAYLLVTALLLCGFGVGLIRWRGLRVRATKLRRWMLVPLGLYVLVAVALPPLLPVFALEPPTGQFAVGTTTRTWQYHADADPASGVPAETLPLRAQFWYPADRSATASTPIAPYATSQTLDSAALESGIPAWLVDSVLYVRTSAVAEAPVANARPTYPVILFLPGEGVPALSYTGLLHDLASHGFVVASLSVVDPQLESHVLHSQAFSDQAVAAIWLPRVRFALARLADMQAGEAGGGVLTGRLDLGHIGILGHSYGGAAALLALEAEPGVSAGIDMDGIFYGAAHIAQGVGKPFLYMDTAQSRAGYTPQEVGNPQNFAVYQQIWARRPEVLGAAGYELTLQGAWHLSFSDFGLYSPGLEILGSLSQEQAHRIVSAYCAAFFQQYLAGVPSPLLAPTARPFPQATLRVGGE